AAGVTLTVIAVPGHSPGGVAFYSEADAVVFTGDALFAGSIGRSDLPGGDHEQLIENIRERLFVLPPDTVVYPGHGPETTIREEMKHNPFFII
ncbi:MAG TPA: MBL fold metallo-hydrolase, partial [Bacteroidales bacterium]|nr:MBL fold metallo-hydrolase [Bacteroidales bacterium]